MPSTRLAAALLAVGGAAATSRPECPLSKVALRDGQHTWTALARPGQLEATAVNCTWYRESTCCSAEDTLRISHQAPEIVLRQSTRGCRDVLHMLMCSPCTPHQTSLFLSEQIGDFTVPVLHVCESLCDQMFQKCASALYGDTGGRVDVTFDGGHQMCSAVGLRVVRHVDHAVCFSAAPAQRMDLRSLLAALAVAVGTTAALWQQGAAARTL